MLNTTRTVMSDRTPSHNILILHDRHMYGNTKKIKHGGLR